MKNSSPRPFEILAHRAFYNNIENSFEGIQYIAKLPIETAIEIDVCCTKDHIAVLSHDITLDRNYGIEGLIYDYTFEELNQIQTRQRIYSLAEIFKLFPQQSFLLDLRLVPQPELMPMSSLAPEDIKLDIASELIEALKHSVDLDPNKIRFMSASKSHNTLLNYHFPTLSIYAHTSRFLRQPIHELVQAGKLSEATLEGIKILQQNPETFTYAHSVLIEPTQCPPGLIPGLKALGLSVIICSAFPPEISAKLRFRLAKWAYMQGADGHIVAKIDDEFAELWQGFYRNPTTAEYEDQNYFDLHNEALAEYDWSK